MNAFYEEHKCSWYDSNFEHFFVQLFIFTEKSDPDGSNIKEEINEELSFHDSQSRNPLEINYFLNRFAQVEFEIFLVGFYHEVWVVNIIKSQFLALYVINFLYFFSNNGIWEINVAVLCFMNSLDFAFLLIVFNYFAGNFLFLVVEVLKLVYLVELLKCIREHW